MKYLDSGVAEAGQTVASWLQTVAGGEPCEFRCQTGYFTDQGSNALLPQLAEWSEQSLPQRLLLGSNQACTLASHVSYLAGALGLHRPNVKLGIVSFSRGLFHPKVYHFRRQDGSEAAYIGSANLTGPGLNGQNVEAGLILDSRDGDDGRVLTEIRERIDCWFTEEREGLCTVTSAADIQRLLEEGYLSLQVERPPPEAGQSGENGERESGPPRPARRILVALARATREISGEQGESQLLQRGGAPAYRFTEASFHYPQGTHLGHILSILWRFASGRQGTSFDDDYIRLRGSLGQGRIAGFRRQIKYKLLATTELGLLTDIRLADDPSSFVPELTDAGRGLWELVAPHVDTDTLVMPVGDQMSAKTPQEAPFYNDIVRHAAEATPAFKALFKGTFEAMPAVRQMQQFVVAFPNNSIPKNEIYAGFFSFEPVLEFCNEVGIDPQTEESAKHRCPFLLNILETLDQIEQGPREIRRL